jgi:phosphopantothenoylcysteine decarboxylase/phosphopantothenate--cysteine ligase
MQMRLAGRKIVLAVSGSIAAYKSVLLLRLLQQAGAEVKVAMTPAAARFVTPLTFSTLSQRPVFLDVWDGGQTWSEHIQIAQWADALVVAPATANTLSKLAQGRADCAISALYLAFAGPVLLAPAMDGEMYDHPATQQNLETLRQRGHTILEAQTGYLASGIEGKGRLAEPELILAAVNHLLRGSQLAGRHVLINAGPTRELLDPVRFLSNHSTGRMGIALAQAALDLGANVTLVLGPTHLSPPPAAQTLHVQNAHQMYEATVAAFAQTDAAILTAAVADYTPAHISEVKIKKQADGLTLALERTQDILAELGRRKTTQQVLAGFALETHDEEAYALGKLERKNLDFVVLNSLRIPGAGFGHETNQITILHRNGQIDRYPLKSKAEVAADIITVVCQHLSAR